MAHKPYHHGNLEEALIEAGIEILAQEGLSGCSLRKVAAACGVSHAAPYKHFPDKEALLEAMQTYMASQFSKALQDALDAHRGDPHGMIYFAQAYLDFFMQHPHYLNLLLMQENHIVNLSKLSEPSSYEPFEVFRIAGIEHLEQHSVPQKMQPTILITMWAVVYGVTMMSVMRGVHYDGDWKQLLSQVLLSIDQRKEAMDDEVN